MGWAAHWAAVKGRSKDDVLEALGFADTGAPTADPHKRPSCAELPSGWVLVWIPGYRREIKRAAALSEGAEVLTWSLEEHVTASAAYGYRDGRRVWSVEWNPEKELDTVEVSGTPPAALDGILKAAQAEEAAQARRLEEDPDSDEVGYLCDVPLDLVESICGFRHDEDIDGVAFTRMKRVSKGKRFLAALFGGRR